MNNSRRKKHSAANEAAFGLDGWYLNVADETNRFSEGYCIIAQCDKIITK